MKYSSTVLAFGLFGILLISCQVPASEKRQKDTSQDSRLRSHALSLPMEAVADTGGTGLQALLQLVPPDKREPISEERIHLFLVPEEIEQLLGISGRGRLVAQREGNWRYYEIGQLPQPKFRLVLFLRRGRSLDPARVAIDLRTFCYDGTLMGHHRLAEWDEEKTAFHSGSLSSDLSIQKIDKGKVRSAFQVAENGKIIPLPL